MRRFVTRDRLAVAAAAAVTAVAWCRPSLEARTAPPAAFGGAGGAEAAEPQPPRIYYQAPFSVEAAHVWEKLQKKVDMRFPHETPLEDFLKAVRAATADKDRDAGIPVYVDPVGLQESEKTMASPVTIDLEQVRLETALRLGLKQLDLAFSVHPDGLLYITSIHSPDAEGLRDANAQILDRLDAIEKAIGALRMRGMPMGGGMGGAGGGGPSAGGFR